MFAETAWIEGLHADLELQRAGRKADDDLAQRLRQPVGIISKWTNKPGRQRSRKNCRMARLDGDVEVEGAVDKFELTHAALQQPLHFRQQRRTAETGRTGTSSDDRQNSHVKGQPREAST